MISLKRKLEETILNIKPKKIMVVGDLMLDQYTWGNVERISPEAPIPIFHVEKEEYRLGGAANTASNISTLKNEVFPIGLIGDDESGEKIKEIFNQEGISLEGVIEPKNFTTILKNRVVTFQQQLLRIDQEKTFLLENLVRKKIKEKYLSILEKVSAVVISNYNKGLLDEELIQFMIQAANKKKIPTICDPGKGVDLSVYKGATTIKPNKSETKNYTGIDCKDFDSVIDAAQKIQDQCNCQFLTISLDKDGILYFEDKNNYHLYETEALEVFDVTGAGDMVISIIAISLASKISNEIAIRLANVAAGLEISHIGVVSLQWKEILQFLSKGSSSQKIKTLEQLLKEFEGERAPILFTNGYFDNLSVGHLKFLQEIENYKGKLVVAINSDESILRQKGKKPELHERDRARLLASIENVHRIIIFDEDNVSTLIESLKPSTCFKGDQSKVMNKEEKMILDKYEIPITFLKRF